MDYSQIPVPLQAQILLRLALAVCALIAGNVLLIFFTGAIAMPFFLLAILAVISGGYLCHTAVRGHYLVLSGTVLHVEHTAVLHRPKAVLIEAEGRALRVTLRSRCGAPSVGGRISFYVHDSTPIYEWREMHLLSSYLAVSDGTPPETR